MRISYTKVPVKPLLTETHKSKRVDFANKYRNWTESDWREVTYCDECSVVIGRCNRLRAWKPRGTNMYDCRKRQYVIKYFKVFAYIDYDGQGELEILTERWSSKAFIRLFDRCMLDHLKTIGRILLQDNDTCHTSRLTAKHMDKNGIKLLDFPPYSCDLNSIENALYIFKKRLSCLRNFNVDLVKEEAKRIWREMDLKYVRTLIDSMPRRLDKVLENKGNITKY